MKNKKNILKINCERQYWLWVTTPEYYYDKNNNESDLLEPNNASDTGGWWTCSKHTKKGDLVLLYRARGACDIKYLIQAESDAYPLGDAKYAKSKNWNWGCDYRPIYKFKNSITISDLKKHNRLQEWNALKASFQSRCFKISYDIWKQLNDLIIEKNPDYRKFIAKVEALRIPENIILEEQLEEFLVKNLQLFKKYGYDLELYFDNNTNRSGRQFVCKGSGGRIDLLCINKKTKGFTIIELKNVKANRITFGQICEYISYVHEHFGKNKKVDGIVVSRGFDTSFQQCLKIMPDKIKHIDLTDLGFR